MSGGKGSSRMEPHLSQICCDKVAPPAASVASTTFTISLGVLGILSLLLLPFQNKPKHACHGSVELSGEKGLSLGLLLLPHLLQWWLFVPLRLRLERILTNI